MNSVLNVDIDVQKLLGSMQTRQMWLIFASFMHPVWMAQEG